MPFDIFYYKISPEVTFLNQVNAPYNPMPSELSAGSLRLLHKHVFLRRTCVCVWDDYEAVQSWVTLDQGKQTSASQVCSEKLRVLFGVICINLTNKAIKDRMATTTSCQISSAFSLR